MRSLVRALAVCVVGLSLGASSAWAQIPPPPRDTLLSTVYVGNSYSPYASRSFPSRPYWGDTHLHTSLSMDAGAFGNRLGVREAYRFARGEEVVASSGIAVRLSRRRSDASVGLRT